MANGKWVARRSPILDRRRGNRVDYGTMNPSKTLPLLGAMAMLPVSAHAAVVYDGFASSTVAAVAPLDWTRVTNGTGASSVITPEKYFATTGPATSTHSQFNTTTSIDRTAGQGFKLTTSFTATSGTGTFENTGLFFMAPPADTAGPRLLFNMGTSNTGLLEFAGTTSQSNNTLANYTTLEGQNPLYTITLIGIFNAGGGLDLTATLTNSVNSTVVNSTAAVTTVGATNNYFGIRTASGSGTGPSASAVHRSYLLETIPEPSHALMTALGGVAMLVRRRRKA